MTKVCKKCNQEKSTESFAKNRANKHNGLQQMCKACQAAYRAQHHADLLHYHKAYFQSNKARMSQQTKQYRQQHRDEYLKYHREYYQANRERILKQNIEYKKERLKTDVQLKLHCALHNRMRHALKSNLAHKAYPTQYLVGCNWQQLKDHIEKLWLPGMSWGNWGKKGWHIDHILPCSAFDLTKAEEQRKCFHYTNLQPLWWLDNIRKGARLVVR